ncbi:MAG: DUF4389 domain-containing protein [Gammaproteobacteria bacterium]
MDVKEHAKNVDTWIRGLFILIFGAILYILFGVIWLLVVFQFITMVVTGGLNKQLEQFSHGLTEYAFQILLYITYQSEERPFPFSPWPTVGAASDKKTAKKKTEKEADKEKE